MRGITDGPFTEAKEVVGGYWFVLAGGLAFEIRPIEGGKPGAQPAK